MNTYSEAVTSRQYCDVIWIRSRYAPKYENPVLCSTSVTSLMLVRLQRHRCGLIAPPSSWNDDVFDCNSWGISQTQQLIQPSSQIRVEKPKLQFQDTKSLKGPIQSKAKEKLPPVVKMFFDRRYYYWSLSLVLLWGW